ncbi:MAG: TraM recognition domain-containing protein [Hyphomicrobium sp.]
MSRAPALFTQCEARCDHGSGHILYAGSSGTGKTQSLISLARHKICDPLTAVIIIDPDGEIAPACYEHIANTQQGLGWRKVHYLRPSSPTEAFALPLLHGGRHPDECHKRALRALTVFSQFFAADAGDFGVRISKYFYLGCLGLALSGRSLVELPELYGHGSRYLRELIGSAFPYPFLTDSWTALDLLSDRAALEYKDPLISRLQPVFGNSALRRVFGPQPPLDIAAVLRNREVVLLDLSGLEHKDSVLVGKAFFNLIYHEALQREPNREPHVFVLLDEAFDFLTPDLARGFDRLRKRNVQLCIAIQRLAQITKSADDDAVGVLSAIISGTRTKVIFRLAEPDDAEFMTRVLFSGHIALNEWKEGTERPVVVGHHKELVRNRSMAEHNAEHEARGETESIAYGTARTHMLSITEAEGESVTDATSNATAIGTMSSEGFGSATSSFDGQSTSASMDPMTGGLFMPPTITNLGASATTGAGMTDIASRSSGRSASDSSGSSHATSTSRTSAVSEGFATTESEVRGYATSCMHGSSRGTSESAGEGETFVATLQWMNSQLYSLPEQLHRLAGEIQNLALRECFVKIDNARPVRTRTVDCPPAFKSAYFRRVMLPLFHQKALAQSPYLFPANEVDAAIAARLTNLLAPTPQESEHDFTEPEPFSVVDAPEKYANDFWKRRSPPTNPTRPPKPLLGRRPDLRVLDGDKQD